MIIVKLKGGLGNQLFQYATGRALAKRTGRSLYFDPESYKTDALRTHRLGLFHTIGSIATNEQIESLNPSKAHYLHWAAKRLAWRFVPYHQRSYLKERHFYFDPAILQASGPAYINGYWQTEKYFTDIRSILLQELQPRAALSSANQTLEERMQQTNSVSLHVRRGDYVANPEAHQIHGTLPLDYHRAAVKHISERIANPYFFIFSDDLNWVKENLHLDHPFELVGLEQQNQDYDDLRLMSRCKNHIIANSSFSWWGAWLNPNKDKLVVAPQKWFNAPLDTRDLTPESWVRL